MIQTITIINEYNEELKLKWNDPRENGFFITNATGLDAPHSTISMTDKTITDGAIYNRGRADKRNIVLNLRYYWANNNEDDEEELRHKCYHFFPPKGNVQVIVKTDKREVQTSGYIETNETDLFAKFEITQISILCEDAYMYGLVDEVERLNGVNPLFEFPFENNSLSEKLIEFGEIYFYYDYTIFYEAEVETGINVSCVFGAETDGFRITNNHTGEVLVINHTFVAEDKLEICTIQGKKSITLNNSDSLFGEATWNKSSWFTLRRGYNDIEVRDGDGNDDFGYTSMKISYPDVYMGA